MQIKNLTPHVINVEFATGTLSFAPEQEGARVRAEEKECGSVMGVPVVSLTWGKTQGLPEPEEGVFLLVSALVREANPTRKDLISPDTGPTAIRLNGQVTAVRRFVTNK